MIIRPYYKKHKEIFVEEENKIITFKNLNRAINNIQNTFASKEVETKIIDTKVSTEKPTNQTVGDLWFVESERN